MNNFGDWLLLELSRRDWSDQRLATAVGVERATVGRWKRNERDPSREHLLKIADALQISPMIVAMAYLGALPRDGEERFSRLPPEARAEVLVAMTELMDAIYRETEQTRRAVQDWSERWVRRGGDSEDMAIPGGK